MQKTFTLLFLLLGTLLGAQTVDFEDLSIEPDSFLNGSDGINSYSFDNISLENDYNPAWESWSGWAFSNTTDVTTPGPGNQYSAITGSGMDGSSNFAVSFAGSGTSVMQLDPLNPLVVVEALYITNATYTYLSMLNGDQFAKKFGGVTGNDPDFLLLTIRTFIDGTATDSVEFYLADYRFEDNSMDYILDEWTYVEIPEAIAVDSLQFSLNSSDANSFGINTPGYFCVDNVITNIILSTPEELNAPKLFEVYPNPASDFIIFENEDQQALTLTIFDIVGKTVYTEQIYANQQQIDIRHLAKGTYIVEVQKGEVKDTELLIKQ